MSPRQWVVPETGDGTGTVTVTRDGDEIRVRWLCGDTRSFTPEDLRACIKSVERTRPFPDVHLEDVDSRGHRYASRLGGDDGNIFYADATTPQVAKEDARSVDWDKLHDALKKALVKPRRPLVRKPLS